MFAICLGLGQGEVFHSSQWTTPGVIVCLLLLLTFCLLVVIRVGSVSVDVLVVCDVYGVLIFDSGDCSAFHAG